MSTYFLDIAIVSLLHYGLAVPVLPALLIGFGIGVFTNYVLCYLVIYRGTEQKFIAGLLIFVSLALVGSVIIITMTPWLQTTFGFPLLIARTCAAGVIGIINFLINTFYNFKQL